MAGANLSVRSAYTISHYRAAVDAHVNVLIAMLIVLAAVMGVVGPLGLASTMSINVLERTRELGVGVMQPPGRSSRGPRAEVL
jgi:putative ABC transport system permease protein